MLVGREREQRDVERVLERARAGESAILALLGEPGVGKTALLEHAAERADGMRLLRARGVESEAHIPFASLLELIRPALAVLDRIPEPQAIFSLTARIVASGEAPGSFVRLSLPFDRGACLIESHREGLQAAFASWPAIQSSAAAAPLEPQR